MRKPRFEAVTKAFSTLRTEGRRGAEIEKLKVCHSQKRSRQMADHRLIEAEERKIKATEMMQLRKRLCNDDEISRIELGCGKVEDL